MFALDEWLFTDGVFNIYTYIPICVGFTSVSQVCLYIPEPEYQRAFASFIFLACTTQYWVDRLV